MTSSPIEPSRQTGISPVTPLRCATHPQVETNLRCGKCGKPICPKCMVQTLVGARCRDCAQLSRLPTYQVSLSQYPIALGVALGLGAVLGVVWGFLSFMPFFFYLNFLVSMGVGYVVGEVTGLVVNRKRGRGLQVIAGVGVFISFVTAQIRFLPGGLLFFYPAGALLNPWNWLALALGIYMAVIRLR